MNAKTLFSGLTFFADVSFYLKWANKCNYSFQYFDIFADVFFYLKKKWGRGGFPKGQWLTKAHQILAKMGQEPGSLDPCWSTLSLPLLSFHQSMFSDYFPLNASFTFTLQRALLKHPHSFTQSLSMVALWNLWFRNLLVAPNYSTSWIPRMCAPDNQESFIGSLHYILCG